MSPSCSVTNLLLTHNAGGLLESNGERFNRQFQLFSNQSASTHNAGGLPESQGERFISESQLFSNQSAFDAQCWQLDIIVKRREI